MNNEPTTVAETLKKNGFVLIATKGKSMEPLLKEGKSSVCIVLKNRKVKRGDVVLFVRENGETVLHRIINQTGGVYSLRGDNQTFTEKKIDESMIIGIMTGYYIGEKFIPTDCIKYKLYVFFRMNTFFVRKCIKCIIRRFGSKI